MRERGRFRGVFGAGTRKNILFFLRKFLCGNTKMRCFFEPRNARKDTEF